MPEPGRRPGRRNRFGKAGKSFEAVRVRGRACVVRPREVNTASKKPSAAEIHRNRATLPSQGLALKAWLAPDHQGDFSPAGGGPESLGGYGGRFHIQNQLVAVGKSLDAESPAGRAVRIRDRQPQPIEPDSPAVPAPDRAQAARIRAQDRGGPAELANQANSTSRAARPRDGKRQSHGEIARHLGSGVGVGMGVGQFPAPAEADQVVRHATFSLPPRSGRPPAAMATKARGARLGRGTMSQESYPFAMVFTLTTHYSQRLPEPTRLLRCRLRIVHCRLVRPSASLVASGDSL